MIQTSEFSSQPLSSDSFFKHTLSGFAAFSNETLLMVSFGSSVGVSGRIRLVAFDFKESKVCILDRKDGNASSTSRDTDFCRSPFSSSINVLISSLILTVNFTIFLMYVYCILQSFMNRQSRQALLRTFNTILEAQT